MWIFIVLAGQVLYCRFRWYSSEMLYAALFNSKLGSGKGTSSQGNSKHANAKTTGLFDKVLSG